MNKVTSIFCFMIISSTAYAAQFNEKIGSLDCYTQAQQQLKLGSSSAIKLCAGSADAAPVACVLEANRQFSLAMNGPVLDLCAKATSLAPVDCVGHAKSKLSFAVNGSALELCSQATIASAPVECVLEAHRQFSFATNGSALKLCKMATSLDPVDCAVKAKNEKHLGTDSILALCKSN
jgi:hypothetical protein